VVLQERVLGLLKEEQEKRGFALLLVSHDLERVNQVCDRVLVMHGGRLVEDVALRRDGAEVRESFRHPYSVLLQRAREAFSERPNVEREQGQGSGGDPGNRDGGCTFAAQCIMRAKMGKPEICTYVVPSLEAVAEHHAVACHFANDA
jgi:ABC-type dipeptide/oligopeptide/nickel transport system ATPase component